VYYCKTKENNNVDFSLNQETGYHAVIASSATGNIIEATASGGQTVYQENIDPDYTFEDLANGEPFISESGAIYNFSYMTEAEATIIRYENGEFDPWLNALDSDWVDIPSAYLPEDYVMSDNMAYMLSIQGDQAAIDAHMAVMAENGTLNNFLIETNTLYDASIVYEQHNQFSYENNSSLLNTAYLDNIDDYPRQPESHSDISSIISSFNEIASNDSGAPVLPADYEMSEDMIYILNLQDNIEHHQNILDNPTGASPEQLQNSQQAILISQQMIDERFEEMIADGSIVDFNNELNLLAEAQEAYAPTQNNILDLITTNIPNIDDSLDNTETLTWSDVLNNPDIVFDDIIISPELEHLRQQAEQLGVIQNAANSDPDNEGIQNYLDEAKKAYEEQITLLVEDSTFNEIKEELRGLVETANTKEHTTNSGTDLDRDVDPALTHTQQFTV